MEVVVRDVPEIVFTDGTTVSGVHVHHLHGDGEETLRDNPMHIFQNLAVRQRLELERGVSFRLYDQISLWCLPSTQQRSQTHTTMFTHNPAQTHKNVHTQPLTNTQQFSNTTQHKHTTAITHNHTQTHNSVHTQPLTNTQQRSHTTVFTHNPA